MTEPFIPTRLICRCCKREVKCINGYWLCEGCREYQSEIIELIVQHCKKRGMTETALSIANGGWIPIDEDWPPTRPYCAVHGDSMTIDMNKDAVCSICAENVRKAEAQRAAENEKTDLEMNAIFEAWKAEAEKFLRAEGFQPFIKGLQEQANNELLTHQSHCCLKHGCKYSNDDCPVVNEVVGQDQPCEECGDPEA
jgi:hypothetical protein